MQGKLIVISAPSWSGKTSLIHAARLELGEANLSYSVSHTTRNPRPGEVDGLDYHFVTQEDFSAMAERGEFLEWTRTFGCSYGTSKTLIDKKLLTGANVVADVDVIGASNIKKLFPVALLVFIAPPSFAVLRERLRARNTETEEAMARRLKRVVEEISYSCLFDFLVINDDFDKAKDQLVQIIATGTGPPMRGDEFWGAFFN
jgi:guanylate kinase